MAKRKVFVKTDLSTPQVEHSRSLSGALVIPSEAIPPPVTVVRFDRLGTGRTGFDFRRWYGAGMDRIVYACQMQIERFIDSQDAEITQATVKTYCENGLKNFFLYLSTLSTSLHRELTIESIDRHLIDGHLRFLRETGLAIAAQKSNYHGVKAVLQALCARGLIREVRTGDDKTFPRNPFAGSHRTSVGERPMPLAARQAFAKAVHSAVMPIFSDDVEPTSELLAYALLVIALHTGRNTQPLLEMTPDCLRAHPKKGHFFLLLHKRRGHSTSKVAVRADRVDASVVESMPTVRPKVADLVTRLINLSGRLRDEAPELVRNRVWLYRTRSTSRSGPIGTVAALNDNTLRNAVKLLVEQRGLLDADGKPMRINVRRLRKTFINRIFEILDGDVVATAVAAGDTVKVTDYNYLRPGEDAARNWKFMGAALVQELLSNTIGASEKTPVGQCSDTRNGDYAPKRDGAVCMSFFNCLRCRNYVVTGDDLHRLFSFYWRILRERARMAPARWKRQFRHIVRLIERDVIEAGVAGGVFKQAWVDQERERARNDPHPFWDSDTIVSDLSGRVS
jgi:hypothetical protein